MYINIYYDTDPTVKAIKSGSFDIGCGGYEFWNISEEKDDNAMFTINYPKDETRKSYPKWLIYFDYYDEDIDENSELSQLVRKFKRTSIVPKGDEELPLSTTKQSVFCFTNDPKPLFKKMQYDFGDGGFFLIRLDDGFVSPGYLWNKDGSYDETIYGFHQNEENISNDRREFNALLKLLVTNGIECSKLVNTFEGCVEDVSGFLSKKDVGHSCIPTAAFITALFVQDLNAQTAILEQQIEDTEIYPLHEKLMDESFENMKLTLFHIGNELGIHECNLIVISQEEIYLIDYYKETKRDSPFRIIKFKSMKLCKKLIKEALFENNKKMYDLLFEVQPSDENEGIDENVTTTCNIFDIQSLPNFKRLETLWDESLAILEGEFKTLKKKNKLDFNKRYNQERTKLESKYMDYMERSCITNDYYSQNKYYYVL